MPSPLYLIQQLISYLLGSISSVQAFHHLLTLSLHFLRQYSSLLQFLLTTPVMFHWHFCGCYRFLGLKQTLLRYCSFSLISLWMSLCQITHCTMSISWICVIGFKLDCGEAALLLKMRVVCSFRPWNWILPLALLQPTVFLFLLPQSLFTLLPSLCSCSASSTSYIHLHVFTL